MRRDLAEDSLIPSGLEAKNYSLGALGALSEGFSLCLILCFSLISSITAKINRL
jgi:hypothetical protein